MTSLYSHIWTGVPPHIFNTKCKRLHLETSDSFAVSFPLFDSPLLNLKLQSENEYWQFYTRWIFERGSHNISWLLGVALHWARSHIVFYILPSCDQILYKNIVRSTQKVMITLQLWFNPSQLRHVATVLILILVTRWKISAASRSICNCVTIWALLSFRLKPSDTQTAVITQPPNGLNGLNSPQLPESVPSSGDELRLVESSCPNLFTHNHHHHLLQKLKKVE